MKNRNYLLAIIANIALAVVCLFVSDIEGLRVVSIIQLVLNTYYYLKGNKKFVSVGLVFFWLLFLFHSSRFAFLEGYGFSRINNNNKVLILLSYKLVTCCFSTLCAGYFITRSKKNNLDVSDSSVDLSDKDLLLLRRVSTYIFIFSLIPFLYVDITRLQYTMAFGYGGLYSLGERDVLFKYFSPISHLFRPAVILLMVSYCRTPKVATRILVWFCVYSLVTMLSGARITALVYILSIVVIYVRFVLARIKKSQFVMIIVVSILLFSFLPVLSSMRREGVISRADYEEAADVVEEAGGGFKSAIMEFGGTQISVIYSMMFTSDFNYGRTYLASLWCISPKLPSYLDKTNLTYTNSFPIDYQQSLGGSCIGEAYYNFGWLAILFFFIVGLLVGRLDHILCCVNRSNLITSIFCLVLIPGLFTWVRDFFMIFVFTGFWIPLIFRLVIGKR